MKIMDGGLEELPADDARQETAEPSIQPSGLY